MILTSADIVRKCQINGGTPHGVNFPTNTTRYVGLSTIETDPYLIPISNGGTLKRLYCWTSSSPGVGQTYAATIMVNNNATAIAGTINEGWNSCSDLIHTAHVGSGDRISCRVVTSSSAVSMRFHWSG